MEEKSRNVFSKVTAVLCALVMLVGIISFFGSSRLERIDILNEQINRKETLVAQNEKELREKEEALTAAKEALEKATQDVSAKDTALQNAEADLDKVCSRSYYSSWNCRYSNCSNLHDAVSKCESELTDAKNTYEACEDEVAELEQRVGALEEEITRAQAAIKENKEELPGLWVITIFTSLAMLLALAGLGLLAKNFYMQTQDKFVFYAVVGLAASSLLFLIAGAINNTLFKNAPPLYVLLSPHAWNLAVLALFAAVLLKKTEKPVLLRNIAIVLAVIVGVLAIVCGAPFVGVLYAAALICTAFVLVPLVFTEYIDIAKHIFLSVITFGIWQLVWTYHVTKNLNKVKAVTERRPARELLLSMFLVLYYPYWLYKTAESVEEYGKENDKEFKIDVLCIAFSFVSPLFATVLIQNKINVVVGKPVCQEPKVQEIAE